MAQYGSYQYESTESRALKGITADSYNKDQAKNLIQLNQNSEYMAAYLRKLQKGVDEANQNIIEQVQSFINDIIVLLGGGGATGLDFGDLKYVFMAIGSLFGFTNAEGEIQLPVNLFSAAWHFFSNFIMPGAQFADVINAIIDQAFATLLGIFGDIPIIGDAIQQFAVIITDLRDALMPLLNAVETLFNAFGGDWTVGDLGAFTDLFGAITEMFAPIIGPPISVLAQVFSVMVTWSLPFIEALTGAVEFVTSLVGGIPLGNITNSSKNVLINPTFDDINSMGSGSGWAWDGTIGKTTNGSAKAQAQSVVRRLDSVAIAVTEGQKITASVWMQWAGLSYSGSYPVVMNIEHFLNGSPVLSPVRLGGQGSPPLNQATWVQQSGAYTIPAGCNSVKLSLKVNSTATNGFVWFDDAELNKTSDGLPMDWIFGLIPGLDGLQSFIQGVLDTFIGIIRGIPLIGGSIADLLENFTGQTSTIISTAATTNQILAALGSGNPDADDFERVNASNLGAKWTIIKSSGGTVAIPNGHDSSFVTTASGDFIAMSDIVAASDNQIASIILATAPTIGADLPFIANTWGRNDIWLRCTPFTTWATRTGLRCRIDSAKAIKLSWFLNGVETVLYTGNFNIIPTAGASFSFEAGTPTAPRRFIAKLNGTPIMGFPEVGTTSQLGSGYRRRAFGGRNEHGTFNVGNAGNNKQWTAEG